MTRQETSSIIKQAEIIGTINQNFDDKTTLNGVKIIAEIKDKIQQIKNKKNNVYIATAGLVNSGKSSLINSLLGKDKLAVGDIETTDTPQEVCFLNNVFFIDMPGLERKIKDADRDKNIYEIYETAALILFVHNLRDGELHLSEIKAINKIREAYPNKTYFWKHFCLVLTFIDAFSNEEASDILKIKEKIIQDMNTKCGAKEVEMFCVSNKRYSFGILKNNVKFIYKSGIPELKIKLANYRGEYFVKKSPLLFDRTIRKNEEKLNAYLQMLPKK